MSEDRVRIEIADHVAIVRMVRADKHNALDAGMFEALHGAYERLADEDGVRAVVLCGEGKSFCSGLDVASFAGGPVSMDDILERAPGKLANYAQRVATDWIDLPVPVIAALHGNCFGGGLQIALGADIRIAAPDTRMCVMEIKWGLVPDMGITQTLPRLAGIDVAKELTFSGRLFDGNEARDLGLVTKVADDPFAVAHELATEIAGKSPDAIRAGKLLYNQSWQNMGPAEALVLETDLQVGLIGSPNQIAAITAAMTKQPGEYVDPQPRSVPAGA